MNRFRIGLAILLLLPLLGLRAKTHLEEVHRPIAREMMAAACCAQTGDPRACDHVKKAESLWLASRSLTASLADHQPMEDIESLMSQLPAHECKEDHTEYAALCAEISRKILAIIEAHEVEMGTVF